MSVHVHIDELVLHGFPAGDRARIADAVQAQLAELFTRDGIPPAIASGGHVDRLNAGGFPSAAAARPETTGGQIAHAVYGALTTGGRE